MRSCITRTSSTRDRKYDTQLAKKKVSTKPSISLILFYITWYVCVCMCASSERADFWLYMCGNFNCSGSLLSHLGPVAPILLHWVPHPRVIASSCLIMVCLTVTRYTYHYYCSYTALMLVGQTFYVRTKRIL